MPHIETRVKACCYMQIHKHNEKSNRHTATSPACVPTTPANMLHTRSACWCLAHHNDGMLHPQTASQLGVLPGLTASPTFTKASFKPTL